MEEARIDRERLRIGICSFTEPGMVKSFYPQGLPPAERLSYYAARFDTLEIDSSFYALPSERNSHLFASRTPDGFVFHFKAFGLLTRHPVDVSRLGRTLRGLLPADFDEPVVRHPPAELLETAFAMFASALEPLARAGKLGVVLFQFPPWFRKSPDALAYIDYCRERLPDFTLAIEFRHGSWFVGSERDDTLAFLRSRELVHTVVDEPQVGIYGSVPAVIAVTAPISYVRFHGRNRDTWTKKGATVAERYAYLYTESELEEWVPHIRTLGENADRTYLMFNNCFAYYAVKNAKMLGELLGIFPVPGRPPIEFVETV